MGLPIVIRVMDIKPSRWAPRVKGVGIRSPLGIKWVILIVKSWKCWPYREVFDDEGGIGILGFIQALSLDSGQFSDECDSGSCWHGGWV